MSDVTSSTRHADAAAPVKKKRRLWLRVLLIVLVLAVGFTAFANYYILTANRDRLFSAVGDIPAREVGLVLGANPQLSSGKANPHFDYRMDAAAMLYHAGKVRHLLVSGDNRRVGYDEPSMMKAALMARGVPSEAITCDYAGLRTYDSVVRARKIFCLSSVTIITQRYHNARAVALARINGLDAIGFCTQDVSLRYSIRTELREVVSRTFAVLEMYVFPHDPRHLGAKEPVVCTGSPLQGAQ